MLSAQAYSFRLQSRLAISLSWVGGYTNVIALLAMGTVVSHMTGPITYFGRGVGQGDFKQAGFFAFLILTFTLGAALSAFITESAKRRGWRSKFMLPIGLEALLLTVFCLHLNRQGDLRSGLLLYEGAGLAALAMGLQNATITKISGAVVRTTHVTGVFTDFGLEGVQYLFWWGDNLSKLRRNRAGRLLRISMRHPSALRLLLLVSIAGSFMLGIVLGTIAYSHWPRLALLGPISFLLWIVLVDWRTPITDIRELDILNDPELRLHGIVSALLPPEVGLYRSSSRRKSGAHRAPSFGLLLDRIPARCRVVVLAISAFTRFDANAVLDLQAAVQRLHDERRKLILAGITPYQFKCLDALGIARVMDINNLSPDLEFAIARAMVLLDDPSTPAAR
jgi:uncharacterized membrane protein YoaK (UPF0700 family)